MKDTTILRKSLKIDDPTEVTVPTSRSNAGPTKHTKGEWSDDERVTITGPTCPSVGGATCREAVAFRHAWDRGEDAETTSRVVTLNRLSNTARSVVAIVPLPESGDRGERDANARLIAAAPAMVEALRDLITLVETHMGGARLLTYEAQSFKRARSVLAQALGEP